MNTILLILGFAATIGAIIFISRRPAAPVANFEQDLRSEIANLKAELQREKSDKDELSGKNKQMYAQLTNIQADQRHLQEKNNELNSELSKLKAEQKQRQQTFEDQIVKLDSAKRILEEEKNRLTQQDQAAKERELTERDRLWNEHEQGVIATLLELTTSREYFFPSYSNNDLPDEFTGHFKPDFLIEFLDQYIIFDAKTTKSDSLAAYIGEQIKKTAEKAKGNAKIYPTIFFVVPAFAIGQMKKLHFYEDGFTFFIISPEALAPILASFKKIASYEFAEQLSPQDREAVVTLIAELYQNINFNNAAHLVLTELGVNSLEKLRAIHPELQAEVEQKREKMRLANFKPADLKKLMQSTHNQQQKIDQYKTPKVDITPADLKIASDSLIDVNEV